MADPVEVEVEEAELSILGKVFAEIFYSPINLALVTICAVLVYKIFSGKSTTPPTPPPPELPPLKKHDMTHAELKKYDGTGSDGRLCVAVNGKVFDVTRGKRYYGPGGPYQAFAGRDASRGLATFNLEAAKDEYDDLSDLNTMEMESVREWDMQFTEKYVYVGRLLKPGEEPTEESEEEESSTEHSSRQGEAAKTEKSKDE